MVLLLGQPVDINNVIISWITSYKNLGNDTHRTVQLPISATNCMAISRTPIGEDRNANLNSRHVQLIASTLSSFSFYYSDAYGNFFIAIGY